MYPPLLAISLEGGGGNHFFRYENKKSYITRLESHIRESDVSFCRSNREYCSQGSSSIWIIAYSSASLFPTSDGSGSSFRMICLSTSYELAAPLHRLPQKSNRIRQWYFKQEISTILTMVDEVILHLPKCPIDNYKQPQSPRKKLPVVIGQPFQRNTSG